MLIKYRICAEIGPTCNFLSGLFQTKDMSDTIKGEYQAIMFSSAIAADISKIFIELSFLSHVNYHRTLSIIRL